MPDVSLSSKPKRFTDFSECCSAYRCFSRTYQYTGKFRHKRCGNGKWYIFFLLSLLFVAAGLVILFVPGLDETVFAYILGISLALAGIFETVIFFILRKYVKRIEDGSEELTVTDGENGIIIKE